MALIAATGLVAHALLLANDGVYWDSWIVHTLIAEGNWEALVAMTRDAGGFPVNLYLRWGLGQLPFGVVGGFHVAVFAAMLGSAWLIYLIANRTGWLTRNESAGLALFTLVYPAYQTSVELNTAKYPITWFVFLLACWCAMGIDRGAVGARVGRRVVALTLFALAFGTASLLVLYWWFGALWLLLSRAQPAAPAGGPRVGVVRWVALRADFVFLPVVYWFASWSLFPQGGDHVGENTIHLTWDRISSGAEGFFLGALRAHWESALARLSELTGLVVHASTPNGGWAPVVGAILPVPVFAIGAAVIAVLAYRSATNSAASLWGPRRSSGFLLAFGLLGLICGTFPYIAVGSWPAESGWTTRHALLVALPLGLCVIGALRLLFAGSNRRWNAAGNALLAVVISLFTVSTVHYYLEWQARWVKDRSVLLHLAKMPEGAKFSLFWVADGVGLNVDGYRFYEYAGMFRRAWGEPGRIGWDVRFQSQPAYTNSIGPASFTDRYNLAGFDPLGCQAVLYVRPGPSIAPPIEMAVRYLYYRALHPERLEAFLTGMTAPEIVPSPAPNAVHCRS
jgi:hypothetical protein